MVGVSIWSLIIIAFLLILTVAWTLLLARIVGKAGYSKWWAIVTLIPLLNIIFIWVFAFSKWPILASESEA